MAGRSGAKISARTVATLCRGFWFCFAACLTWSLDDDLELSGLGEGTLNDLHGLDAGDIRLGRICQDETHTCHTVRYGCDVFLTAYKLKQFFGIFNILSHSFPFCRFNGSTPSYLCMQLV